MAPLAPRSWPYARHSRGIYRQYIYGFNSLYLYYAVYLDTPLSSRDIIHVSSCSPWNCPSAWKWLRPSLWSWVRRRVRRCGSLDAAHQRVCLLWIYDPIKSERLFDWAGGQILAHFPIILDCFLLLLLSRFGLAWSWLAVVVVNILALIAKWLWQQVSCRAHESSQCCHTPQRPQMRWKANTPRPSEEEAWSEEEG